MSKTSRFLDEIQEISAIDEALRHQLKRAEIALNDLFIRREKLIRLINDKKWDVDQYLLDDLQQKLADISEELADFSALPYPINKFLAA